MISSIHHCSRFISFIRVSILTVLFLTSCGNWGGGSGYNGPPVVTHEIRTVPDPETEKRAVVEHELRVKSEERLQTQETTTGHWRSLSFILSACGALMLVLGAALGASARHEAQKK